MAYGDLQKCPECGGDYLHQSGVEVYFRDREDAGAGLHVTVQTEGVVSDRSPTMRTDRSMNGNPSIYRDGTTVRFWCEDCDATVAMHIVQHKGNTFIRWE